MKARLLILICFLLSSTPFYEVRAQEEESAAVFLEEYTDEFQEKFFEALKQKGIENYDRAINLFLECKLLDENSAVIDHELAKVYLADKRLNDALAYALNTVIAEPENLWYLNTLVNVIQRQGSSMDLVKNQIPYENENLKGNLALIYYKQRRYESALNILKSISTTTFSKNLSSKIKDSLAQQTASGVEAPQEPPSNTETDPLSATMIKLEHLIRQQDFPTLEKAAEEASEHFPSQPFFYYARGLALVKAQKQQQAVSVLEEGLDYLLDDPDLANKIYKTLAEAYRALGNVSKANMYLSKIKSRS